MRLARGVGTARRVVVWARVDSCRGEGRGELRWWVWQGRADAWAPGRQCRVRVSACMWVGAGMRAERAQRAAAGAAACQQRLQLVTGKSVGIRLVHDISSLTPPPATGKTQAGKWRVAHSVCTAAACAEQRCRWCRRQRHSKESSKGAGARGTGWGFGRHQIELIGLSTRGDRPLVPSDRDN